MPIEKTVDLDGNIIRLVETEYDCKSSCSNTYHRWTGKFKIESSTYPVNQNEVDRMRQNGLFGYGQSVGAMLAPEQEIHFYGVCDSGD